MPKMSLMGYELSLNKKQDPSQSQSVVDVSRIRKAIELLKEYSTGKQHLEQQIIENERWYKSQHWDIIRQKAQTGEPEPTTAYLFNTIANKHADFMDNYPEPTMLPREENDLEESKQLTNIVPSVIERNEFKTTYDNAGWYKLKNGTSACGVFWNEDLENGLGDIDIQKLDLLNLYWQPGIDNIQKSPNFFILTYVDTDLLPKMFPDKIDEAYTGSKIVVPQDYFRDDTVDWTKKSIIVDWYYKDIDQNGKKVLHMTKFLDEINLGSTEDDIERYPNGLYDHGQYPVVFDVLFPEEGSPCGFGYVHVVKNPQMYIDKLDQLISKNALLSGKQRVLYKTTGPVDVKDLLDYSKDAIPCNGDLEANFKFVQAESISPAVTQHRENKIAELKEISGANDFSRGEGGKGITAASAIMALQEAGNKLSRDMIQRSYVAFSQITYMTIELIRQFYDQDRPFRVDGKNGAETSYITYNNQKLREQPLPTMYEGEEQKFRKAIFDIKVKPQKQSPFNTMAHNELAKELYRDGFFDPQRADQALIALEMMTFDGKDSIIQKIQKNQQMMQMLQQLQMQMQQMQQENMQLRAGLQRISGNDLGASDYLLQQQQSQDKVAKSVYGANQLQAE